MQLGVLWRKARFCVIYITDLDCNTATYISTLYAYKIALETIYGLLRCQAWYSHTKTVQFQPTCALQMLFPGYVPIHKLPDYSDVIISAMASQITCVSIVYSAVCSDADQRKHQSSASLAFVRGIHRWPVNSPHKGLKTRKKIHLMTSSCFPKISVDLDDGLAQRHCLNKWWPGDTTLQSGAPFDNIDKLKLKDG